VQAGTVGKQVGLSDIAAHAVPEQEKWGVVMLVVYQLSQLVQVILYPLPAAMVGEVADDAVLGCQPMAALIEGVKIDAILSQCLAKVGIASTVFAHAVGQHDHGAGRCATAPVIHMHRDVVMGGQREGLMVHDESFEIMAAL
jgi:hypothetical protein